MRIAIYSRKSIETDTGESIKNQIKLCTEYFKNRFSDVKFEIFEDEGFSGGNINRPSFQRMMDLVKIKQFDIVAVYKIDRIARNIVDFINVYDELDKMNVQLISITEGFDPSTPVGKMMMLMLASFAEMERMNIAQRVKDNMRELAKMGRWSGGTPPTGYSTKKIIEDGKKITYLELIEDEGINIKKIFEMYAEGLSTYSISKFLGEKGFNYPSKTIQNILTNPTYLASTKESIKYLETTGYTVYGKPNTCGFLPYNRRPRIKGIKKSNDISKFIGVSKHKAIIDLDLWIKVQEKLKAKSVDPHPNESNYTFLSGGIIKCKCGSSMFVYAGGLRKDGTRVRYFRCMNRKENIKCDNKFLRVTIAEQSVIDFLKKFVDKKDLRNYINKTTDIQSLNAEIKSINKQIDKNNKSIDNLVEKMEMMSNEAAKPFAKRIEYLTSNNINLKEELFKLERIRLFENMETNNVDALHNQIKLFLNTEDTNIRRLLIKTIIKEAVWDSSTGRLYTELLV